MKKYKIKIIKTSYAQLPAYNPISALKNYYLGRTHLKRHKRPKHSIKSALFRKLNAQRWALDEWNSPLLQVPVPTQLIEKLVEMRRAH